LTKNISIVGMGYVGLCTALALTSKNYSIIPVDKDPNKIDIITKGSPPFHEPDLEELLLKATKNGLLKPTMDTKKAIADSDITFITVGTPSNPDGSINLKQIESAAREIGKALRFKETYHLLIVKSTVVPGTTQNVVGSIIEKNSGKTIGKNFGLCMNPEFLREGSAIKDALYPDRIVIGEYDKKSGDTLQNLYLEFHHNQAIPIIRTNIPTAELIKYANNAFLATKISYINTIANICERIPNAYVKTVAHGIGLDQRINPRFLNAGLGYGGSCFPKDLQALISFSKKLGYAPSQLEATHQVNEEQATSAVEKAKELIGNLKGKKIALLGLSFKPDTDDMREARAIPIINQLLTEDAKIVAYDPVAIPTAKKIFGDKIKYANSAKTCLKDADCCILVTEWNEFKQLTPHDFKQQMKEPNLIDGRRVYNPQEYSQQLNFRAIGLGPNKP